MKLAVLTLILLGGCASNVTRDNVIRVGFNFTEPSCDRTKDELAFRIRIDNQTSKLLTFPISGTVGPPFTMNWAYFRVLSQAPGQTSFKRTHNLSHVGVVFTEKVKLSPGDATEFGTTIYGLRPKDFDRPFQIEFKDNDGRAYSTGTFRLCPEPHTAAVSASGKP